MAQNNVIEKDQCNCTFLIFFKSMKGKLNFSQDIILMLPESSVMGFLSWNLWKGQVIEPFYFNGMSMVAFIYR